MTRTTAHAIFVLIVLSATATLFLLSADRSSQQYAYLEQAVRDIDERNSELDSAVLLLRLGLKSDYDDLTRVEKQLATSCPEDNLGGDSGGAQNLFIDFTNLKTLTDRKAVLSNDFKASHAIVRNSLAGFLHSVRMAQSSRNAPGRDFATSLTRLETTGSRYYLSGSERDRRELQDAIEQVEVQMELESNLGRRVDDARLAARHGRKLIECRNELDQTVSKLVAVPIHEAATEIMDRASVAHYQNTAITNRYRMALSAVIVLLIGYCTFQFLSLLRHSRIIRESNEKLEQKVAERTQELSETNRRLVHSVEEAEKLALVAKYTDNAVIITDADGRIEWVNEGFTRISGYSRDEVLGCVPGHLLQGEKTNQDTVQQMREALETKQGFDVELINYHKSGKPYWLTLEVRPIHNAEGETVKFIAIESDITERKDAEAEREKLGRELRNAAHQAGMAEVATGVLHNVGNVLNSVNVSANLLMENLHSSRIDRLEKASQVLSEQEQDLPRFLTSDTRGKHLPRLLKELSANLVGERDRQIEELRSLVDNVEHVKEIVSMQQTFAKKCGTDELVNLVDLMEDALKLNDAGLIRHSVDVVRKFDDIPPVLTEKHKVLQILVNLISNAKHALSSTEQDEKILTLAIAKDESRVRVQVGDNGVGIASADLTKIFTHGFTTKKEGHGFGLHSSALAAQELGGSLSAHSEGRGMGAVFSLQLPIEKEALCKV